MGYFGYFFIKFRTFCPITYSKSFRLSVKAMTSKDNLRKGGYMYMNESARKHSATMDCANKERHYPE